MTTTMILMEKEVVEDLEDSEVEGLDRLEDLQEVGVEWVGEEDLEVEPD